MDRSIYTNIIQESIEHLILAEDQICQKDEDIKEKDLHYQDDLEQFWRDLGEKCDEYLEKLLPPSGTLICGRDAPNIWQLFDLISKKLSFECTKFCISFINKPLPTSSETSGLLDSVEKTVLGLVSIYYKLDPSFGKTLHTEVYLSSMDTIQSVRQLLKVTRDDDGFELKQRYFQATGIAWEGCKYLEKCSHTNKDAVRRLLVRQSEVVSDGYAEISEALKGDGSVVEFDDTVSSETEEDAEPAVWSEKDKELVVPVANLIKAAKILYKRILEAVDKNGRSDTKKRIEDFDQLYEDCTPASSTIDNLILELYAPLNVPEMELWVQKLASHLRSTIKTAINSHLITENEQANIEFIEVAIAHNLDKLKNLLKDS